MREEESCSFFFLSLLAIGSLALNTLAKEERELFFAFMLETIFFPSLTEEAAEEKEGVVSLLFAGRLPLLRTARQRRRERMKSICSMLVRQFFSSLSRPVGEKEREMFFVVSAASST